MEWWSLGSLRKRMRSLAGKDGAPVAGNGEKAMKGLGLGGSIVK